MAYMLVGETLMELQALKNIATEKEARVSHQ